MSKRVIVMNSGGPDSACVMSWCKNQGLDVVSVYLDFDATNRSRAMKAAQISADLWAVEHHIARVDLGKDPGYWKDSTKCWYSCPMISMLSCMMGTLWAVVHGIQEVYIAVHGAEAEAVIEAEGGDAVRTERWIKEQALFLDRLIEKDLIPERIFPVFNMRKPDELVWAGLTAKDLAHTVSCNDVFECGRCPNCRDRKEMDTRC